MLHLHQTGAPVAGVEPATSPAIRSTLPLSYTGDTLFTRASRAFSRCCVLSMRYCPSMDPIGIRGRHGTRTRNGYFYPMAVFEAACFPFAYLPNLAGPTVLSPSRALPQES